MIKLTELIGEALLKIWLKPEYKPFCTLDPVMPEMVNPNSSLLFIGLNPSKRKKDTHQKKGAIDTFPSPSRSDGYYKKFYDIAEKSGFENHWTHFDLLYFKEMQNQVEQIRKNVLENGHIFIYEQLHLTKLVLNSTNPKIIVVCNRLAARFMGKHKRIKKNGDIVDEWMGLKFLPVENEEYFLWNGIPIIFTVQLNRFCKNDTIDKLIDQINRIKTKSHEV